MKTKKQIKYVGECGNCHNPNWSPSHDCLKPEKTQHTPTPWKRFEDGHIGRIVHQDEHSLSVEPVAYTTSRKRAKEDGELIVRAVNSHEALLEAAKNARWAIKDHINGETPDLFEANELLNKAIAQAEGK